MKTEKERFGFTPTPIRIAVEQANHPNKRKLVRGFTITELLTVMAVIAMLLGILVPALNLVRRLAKDTNQRAQLHGIDVGLETFSNDNDGYYPDSRRLDDGGAGDTTVGAQRLAEALVGRDMLGLDPNTTWDADKDKNVKTTYASTKSPKMASQPQVTASLARRQGPYLDITKTEAFQVCQLYSNTAYVYDGNEPGAPAPVLTDTYRVKRVVMGGKTVMAGTPVLYYKANAMSLTFPDTDANSTIPNDPNCDSIYCNSDNQELVDLGQMMKTRETTDDTTMHLFDTAYQTNKGIWNFYDKITNKQITSQPRPYSATTYILMSAGYDGVFGTRDDIYNFE